jgi:hypothetical protein
MSFRFLAIALVLFSTLTARAYPADEDRPPQVPRLVDKGIHTYPWLPDKTDSQI